MSSATEVCNIALGRLGVGQQISDLTDTSATALACALIYDQCLEEVLLAHDWSFAERRVSLALVTGDPPLPWAYQYRYPSDVLKLRAIDPEADILIEESRIAYEVSSDTSGRLIYCDLVDAVAIYTALITDLAQWRADVRSALSWRLAAELAMPVAKLPALRDNAEQHYLLALQRAISADGSEFQRRIWPDSEFQQARN